MLLIRAPDLERCCPMDAAIEAVAGGFRALSAGAAAAPLRLAVPLQEGGTLLAMPAAGAATPYYVLKAVAVAPAARERGGPLVSALVTLGNATTGAPLALLDGSALTALRTGAAGGLAARLLARGDAERCGLFGAGAQARAQLLGLAAARRLREVRVVARSPESAERLVRWAREREELDGVDVRAAAADDAVAGADVVVTATDSATAVFRGALLAAGTHVTAVGSYTPAMRELDDDAMRGARIVVDERGAALREAGELAALAPDDVVEIGEVVAGTAAGRADDDERTVFKSVGNAVQDLVTAAAAYERARALGIGDEIPWP